MAYYLVKAKPTALEALKSKLDSGEIREMRPFGTTMHTSLSNARQLADGTVTWEEQCFCSPPLKQEREVLDQHFTDLTTQTVDAGEGWSQIASLPKVWDSV